MIGSRSNWPPTTVGPTWSWQLELAWAIGRTSTASSKSEPVGDTNSRTLPPGGCGPLHMASNVPATQEEGAKSVRGTVCLGDT